MTALGSYCRGTGDGGRKKPADKPTPPHRATSAASQRGRGMNTRAHGKQTQTQGNRWTNSERNTPKEQVEGSTWELVHRDIRRRDPESRSAHASTHTRTDVKTSTHGQAHCTVVAKPDELRKNGLPRNRGGQLQRLLCGRRAGSQRRPLQGQGAGMGGGGGLWEEGEMRGRCGGRNQPRYSGSWGASPPSPGRVHVRVHDASPPRSARDNTTVHALKSLLRGLWFSPHIVQSGHVLDSPTGAANPRRREGARVIHQWPSPRDGTKLRALHPMSATGGEVFNLTRQPWSPHTCSKPQETITSTHTHTHPKSSRNGPNTYTSQSMRPTWSGTQGSGDRTAGLVTMPTRSSLLTFLFPLPKEPWGEPQGRPGE